MKRTSLPLLALVLFVSCSLAFARGNFAYITVAGQGLAEDLTLTNEAFTRDFFAFADFDKNKIEPPTDFDPDFAFKISRFYIANNKAVEYDKLYYYPDQGYVYYAASEEEASPYVDQWYTANPSMEAPFRAALGKRASISWIALAIFIVLLIAFVIYYFNAKPQAQTPNQKP